MESNPAIPSKSLLFEPVKDAYGIRLALVFGNEFTDGKCPFSKRNQCNHCEIGNGEGLQFNLCLNLERLDFFKKYYAQTLSRVNHLIIYNSGSTLNPKEMSRETLKQILNSASLLERCKVISLDSREMFITKDSLDFILENIRQDQQARIILGVESQDDEIRIKNLNKSMTKQGIEKAFSVIEKYFERVAVDVNIVFQPPELTAAEAIHDAVETVKYILNIKEYRTLVDFNYHPFYPTRKSRTLYPNHQRANLEVAKECLFQIVQEIKSRKANSKIFVGLEDEDHDLEPNLRTAELNQELSFFKMFNRS